MSNLLKEALADAKAVRETAFLNAKASITESFQPTIQRMVANKLSEEEGEEEVDTDDAGFGSFEDEFADDSAPVEEPEMADEDDVELENLMRELDGMDDEFSMDEGDEEDWSEPIQEMDDEDFAMEGDEMPSDEEIYEMIVREMEGEEEMFESTEGGGSFEEDVPNRTVNTENRRLRNEVKQLKKQKNEALLVVSKLKKTLNEINLLNAKLLYNTKVSRQYDLNKQQRTAVLENLDRAVTKREVELIYATICESLNKVSKMKKGLKEGFASKATPTMKKSNLSENTNMVARWKELANIK